MASLDLMLSVNCRVGAFSRLPVLDPENEYEVAIKLGPLPSGKDAKDFVAEWKRAAKQLYDAREYVRLITYFYNCISLCILTTCGCLKIM